MPPSLLALPLSPAPRCVPCCLLNPAVMPAHANGGTGSGQGGGPGGWGVQGGRARRARRRLPSPPACRPSHPHCAGASRSPRPAFVTLQPLEMAARALGAAPARPAPPHPCLRAARHAPPPHAAVQGSVASRRGMPLLSGACPSGGGGGARRRRRAAAVVSAAAGPVACDPAKEDRLRQFRVVRWGACCCWGVPGGCRGTVRGQQRPCRPPWPALTAGLPSLLPLPCPPAPLPQLFSFHDWAAHRSVRRYWRHFRVSSAGALRAAAAAAGRRRRRNRRCPALPPLPCCRCSSRWCDPAPELAAIRCCPRACRACSRAALWRASRSRCCSSLWKAPQCACAGGGLLGFVSCRLLPLAAAAAAAFGC